MGFRNQLDSLKFTNDQRKGLFLLFGIIIVLQLICYFVDFTIVAKDNLDKHKWLSLQVEVDSMKTQKQTYKPTIYLFNPNFISDYKGYKLGMSVEEIDRLLAFREKNKYVNSAEEFQKVTKISDSLLNVIAPFFKFPDWVKHKKGNSKDKEHSKSALVIKEKIVQLDINQATQQDLIKVNGVGDVLSLRILSQKEKLGGFVSMEQLKEIWGLSPETLLNLNKYFAVINQPNLKKIDVNNASLKELNHFFYFKNDLARQIVKYRSMYGDFKNIDDLIKVKDFPIDKANIINLYLSF